MWKLPQPVKKLKSLKLLRWKMMMTTVLVIFRAIVNWPVEPLKPAECRTAIFTMSAVLMTAILLPVIILAVTQHLIPGLK